MFAGERVGAAGFAREVAIKRIHPALCDDPAFERRFVREVWRASLLCHPNIASVLDFDRDADGCYFVVTERVFGTPLRAFAHTGDIPEDIAVFIAARVLRALAHAHERCVDACPIGIVHRNVSPDNALIAWNGVVKVIDFGVAGALEHTRVSLTRATPGRVADTLANPCYISPEQVLGMPVDGRADVFSAGVMLYEMLTSAPLFADDAPKARLQRLLRAKIPSPRMLDSALAPDISSICLRMLARDRNARFSSARQAARALEQCAVMRDRSMPALRNRLRALLGERFPGRATPHDTSPPVVLVHEPVPIEPSMVMPVEDEPVATSDGDSALACTREPTWTAPPHRRAARGRPYDRARRWIGSALAISLAIIGLALYLTCGLP